jgi:hypothetical protein
MLLKGLKGTHLFIPRIGKFRANTAIAISFRDAPINQKNVLKFEQTSACMHH